MLMLRCTRKLTELGKCGQTKTPGHPAGRLHSTGVDDQRETRSALSELPIAVKAAAMPLAVLVG